MGLEWTVRRAANILSGDGVIPVRAVYDETIGWSVLVDPFVAVDPFELVGEDTFVDQAAALLGAAEVLLGRDLDESLLDAPSGG